MTEEPGGGAPSASQVILLRLAVEKEPGNGEDAPPLSYLFSNTSASVAVFDGMGGAGAAMVETVDGAKSSAWVASRCVRDVVLDWLDDVSQESANINRDVGDLERRLKDRLARLREKHESSGGKTRIRGTLMRPFPTTMALAHVRSAASGLEIRSIWAGDSRVYVLTPTDGLQQVTVDDLKGGGDAQATLIQDAPLSNCVTADGKFSLRETIVALDGESALVLAATDGCFSYVPTPAHFELLILDCVDGSQDWDSFTRLLERRIRNVTGDDATMSVAAIGWTAYEALAAAFGPRLRMVRNQTEAFNTASTAVEALTRDLDDAKRLLVNVRESLWTEYRLTYEAFIRRSHMRSQALGAGASDDLLLRDESHQAKPRAQNRSDGPSMEEDEPDSVPAEPPPSTGDGQAC